jgi:5-methylcytosine-specific restriction endonuclease McrA
MKLQSLKPRVRTLALALVTAQPVTVERKRGSAGVKDRARIKTRDCGLCQECMRNGKTVLGQDVDHITPLWAGGSDEDRNKELLCVPCHEAKTAREAADRGRWQS